MDEIRYSRRKVYLWEQPHRTEVKDDSTPQGESHKFDEDEGCYLSWVSLELISGQRMRP